MRQTYYVVVSAVGTVWRVFNSRQRLNAMDLARRMSMPGNSYFVDMVRRTNAPTVGTRL